MTNADLRGRYAVTLVNDGVTVHEISIPRRHRDLLQVALPPLGVWELEGMDGQAAFSILEAAFVDVTTPEHAAAYSYRGSPDALTDVIDFIGGVMVQAGHHPEAVFRVR